MFWLTDPKTGKKSVTLTFTVITFSVAMLKWLLDGFTLFNFIFPAFDVGATTAMLTLTLGSYVGRKAIDVNKK